MTKKHAQTMFCTPVYVLCMTYVKTHARTCKILKSLFITEAKRKIGTYINIMFTTWTA